jgi:hypothetical protein
MRYELPSQKEWPCGVHPPGNSSAVTTPTMEKLTVQGNHPVEQKEVSFYGSRGEKQALNSGCYPDCSTFLFRRLPRY